MSQIPGVEKPISRVVLGTMIISSSHQDESFKLLDEAYDCGVNTFDTAAVYAGGESEKCLGAWLKSRGLRDEVVILDKGCITDGETKRVTPKDLESDLNQALDRLQTDTIDMYVLHRDDLSVPVGPMVEAFNGHLAAGRINAFGGSNWTTERIMEANRYADEHGLVGFTVNSPNYSLAEQVEDPWGPGCVSLSGPLNRANRDWFVQNRMAIFAYSSLARGLFSGRMTRENFRELADDACRTAYCHEVNFKRLDRATELAEQKGVTVTQIALAYVLTSRMNTFALVGAQNRTEIEQCIVAQSISLSDSERTWLNTGGSGDS